MALGRRWPDLPVTQIQPEGRVAGVEIVLNDAGRAGSTLADAGGLVRQHRVMVVDLLGTGESHVTHQYHMVAASAGLRPLGLQTVQLQAVIDWARRRFRVDKVHLRASEAVMPIVALLAAALGPGKIADIELGRYLGSLDRLIDLPMSYAAQAPLYCVGLLAEIDLPDMLRLATGFPVHDLNLGPLQKAPR